MTSRELGAYGYQVKLKKNGKKATVEALKRASHKAMLARAQKRKERNTVINSSKVDPLSSP